MKFTFVNPSQQCWFIVLLLSCFLWNAQCKSPVKKTEAVEISGSGTGSVDVDTQDGEVEEVGSGITGSGSITTAEIIPTKPPKSTTTTIVTTTTTVAVMKSTKTPVDDEDGDSADGITYSGATDAVTEPGSGDSQSPEDVKFSTQNLKCTSSFLYCWCVDDSENEVPGTRRYMDKVKEVHNMHCLNITTTSTTTTALPPSEIRTTKMVKTTERTTARFPIVTRPKVNERTTEHPYFIGGDAVKPTRIVKPVYNSEEAVGVAVDKDGIFRKDDVRVDRKKLQPLFTHPGILAALIGGGVVALLCALLLVMFIVYRMRKKDEGSYPLDPNAKPPRLDTYTKTPNKEFYA